MDFDSDSENFMDLYLDLDLNLYGFGLWTWIYKCLDLDMDLDLLLSVFIKFLQIDSNPNLHRSTPHPRSIEDMLLLVVWRPANLGLILVPMGCLIFEIYIVPSPPHPRSTLDMSPPGRL